MVSNPSDKNYSIFHKFFSLLSVVRGYNILILVAAQYLAAIFIFSPEASLREVLLDFNLSGSVTTFDMIEIQKLILGINNQFSNAPSWGFVSPQGNLFNILTLNDLQQDVNLNIIGLKIGDVNYSADTAQ